MLFRSRSRPDVLPPGPGLAEAVAWTCGCHLIQLFVFLLFALGLLWCAAPRFPPSLDETIRIVDDLGWESSFLFTGVTTLAALLVVFPLVRIRIGPRWRESLGFRRLSLPEVLLLAAAVAPLAVFSDQLYRWGQVLNEALVRLAPELSVVARYDAMDIIRRQAESTAYPVLLIALALAPAIGEELVFRGLIGRGLIARWGAPAGVIVATLLFAAAHGTPAHALATIPVGLCLHLAYRFTGALWAPILLHALNNSLAVTLMKLGPAAPLAATPALIFASIGYVAVIGALLYETSRRREANRTPALALPRRCGASFPMLATCSILAFTCLFVWSNVALR